MKKLTGLFVAGVLAVGLVALLPATALAASVVKARSNNSWSPATMNVSTGTGKIVVS